MSDVKITDAYRAFARIGFLSFGGPAAQIAVMHKVLVEEKRWLSEQQFLHALNFCMLLPGPEAMQLTTYAGWLLHGVRGGLIAGLLFIVPGLLMMLALSALYVAFGDVPLLTGLFYGLKAAVLAVVLQALMKVSKKALKSPIMYGVALFAFTAIFFFALPFPIVILLAAIFGIVMQRVNAKSAGEAETAPLHLQASASSQSWRALLIWGALWLVPLALLVLVAGDFWGRAALFFSQTAIVTFGGAYAVLTHVAQQVVEGFGWLSADDMLTGLGLAETTLGPLVLVLVFTGFVGAANVTGGSLLAGLGGGLIAAFFTFVPCFLWIFVGAPHMERLRHVKWLSAALSTVTAAVVGVIGNLAVWFALNVLFGTFETASAGAFRYPLIDLSRLDWVALAIALASGVALLRLKIGMMPVLAVAAIAGLAAQQFLI